MASILIFLQLIKTLSIVQNAEEIFCVVSAALHFFATFHFEKNEKERKKD
jgi:hypothetical protein